MFNGDKMVTVEYSEKIVKPINKLTIEQELDYSEVEISIINTRKDITILGIRQSALCILLDITTARKLAILINTILDSNNL